MFLVKYYKILKENSSFSLLKLIFLGVVGGVSGTGLLIVINSVIGVDPNNENFYKDLFIGYVLVLGVHFIVQAIYQASLVRLAQNLVWAIRIKTLNNVRNVDLIKYLSFGGSRIYSILTTDAYSISVLGNWLSGLVVAAVTILSCLIYLAFITPFGLLVTIGVMVLIMVVYQTSQTRIVKQLEDARKTDDSFFELLDSVTLGIKELKLDKRRSDKLFAEANEVGAKAKALRIKSLISLLNNGLLGDFFFFLVLALFLFILPYFNFSLLSNSSQYILVILYIMRPAQQIAHSVTFFYNASIGIDHFNDLSEISKMNAMEAPSDASYFGPLETVSLKNICFAYNQEEEEESPFSLGPIDLELRKGEVVFLTGGNGSGKTTFINMLTGLYPQTSGSIEVNGMHINKDNVQGYRDLFAAVFTDDYLFKTQYGWEGQDDKMNEIIADFGLSHKVKFEDNRFSTTDLSYGQKKRLSLASSLIQDKPIYVFDEVVANQDFDFKDFFYTKIVADLKRKGKIVFIVSHNEKYFHIADKHYNMEIGKLSYNERTTKV